MNRQGVEIVPESLTHLWRGGRPATRVTWRWETDCRTLALSRRKLDLLTSIRGDKANEPSERGRWCDTIKSLWHQGSLPSELSEGQTVIRFFAEVLSCSYLIKLSLYSGFQCFFPPYPSPSCKRHRGYILNTGLVFFPSPSKDQIWLWGEGRREGEMLTIFLTKNQDQWCKMEITRCSDLIVYSLLKHKSKRQIEW